jgi:hypothetical protein
MSAAAFSKQSMFSSDPLERVNGLETLLLYYFPPPVAMVLVFSC